MKNRCGAWQVGESSTQGKIEFRIFFPNGVDPGIASIRVAGEFQENQWDFDNGLQLTSRAISEGTFWEATTPKEIPAGYYQYKYFVLTKG